MFESNFLVYATHFHFFSKAILFFTSSPCSPNLKFPKKVQRNYLSSAVKQQLIEIHRRDIYAISCLHSQGLNCFPVELV